MKKIFFSSFLINVMVMVMHFSTGILSARNLGPEGRGELAVVTRWSSLFGLLLMFGLPAAVTFLGKQLQDRQREYMGAYLLLGTSIGIVGAIAGQFLMPLFLANQSPQVVWLVCISLISLPTVLLADGLIGTMTTMDLYRRVLFLRFFSPFGTLLLIVGLIVFGAYDVDTFVYGNLIWGVLFFGLNAYLALSVCPPSWNSLKLRSRELSRKGRQMFMPNLVTLFGDNLDQIVISIFLTPTVLGYYAVAGSVGSILPSVILGTLAVFLLPKLMELRSVEKRRSAEKIHGSMFYGSAAVAGSAGLLLPFLLPLLYGKEFETAVLMGEVLLLITPFRIGYNVLMNYISSEDKFRFVTEAEIAGLLLGAATTLSLLPFLGGIGAAIGTAVSAVTKWVYIVVRSMHLGLKFGRLIRFDLVFMLASFKGLLVRKQIKVRESG